MLAVPNCVSVCEWQLDRDRGCHVQEAVQTVGRRLNWNCQSHDSSSVWAPCGNHTTVPRLVYPLAGMKSLLPLLSVQGFVGTKGMWAPRTKSTFLKDKCCRAPGVHRSCLCACACLHVRTCVCVCVHLCARMHVCACMCACVLSLLCDRLSVLGPSFHHLPFLGFQ